MVGGRQKSGSASIDFRIDPDSLMTRRWTILRLARTGATPMSQAILQHDHAHGLADPSYAEMNSAPGAPFRLGSDRHYPEKAPVHRFTVDGFRIDRTPVTNRQFRDFVRATGH